MGKCEKLQPLPEFVSLSHVAQLNRSRLERPPLPSPLLQGRRGEPNVQRLGVYKYTAPNGASIFISRADQPLLFWAYEILVFAVGAICIVLGIQRVRAFLRWQREFEREAYEKFLREKGVSERDSSQTPD